MSTSSTLPRPGLVWGLSPERRDDDAPRPRPAWPGLRHVRRIAADAARWAQQLAPADEAGAIEQAARALRRQGFTPETLAQALGVAAAAAPRCLGMTPRPVQLVAAAALLDGRIAEMATGEGKTLAVGLAAAAAGLSGMPVHVATANDYLAQRDQTGLDPLFRHLGLSSACVTAMDDDDARRQAYRADITYATARSLAFDDLRDRHRGALRPEARRRAAALAAVDAGTPLMRGLCLALIDEADSLLLDEADMPLVLSRPSPAGQRRADQRRALLWQALALARQLQPSQHFQVFAAERQALLTAAGEQALAQRAQPLGGAWARPRWRREAVQSALTALHGLARDRHYLVRDDTLHLLDEVTGRIAEGRQWSRGLQALVQLKEGLPVDDGTETIARTTYARYFGRYWRLGGLSATVWEARAELRHTYGTPVLRIARHHPSRLQHEPVRRVTDDDALDAAIVASARACQQAGRPVLIGTDSVADSERLAAALRAAGLDCQVLNARHDAQEAALVAEAGRAGRITVATRMAGRGTDIALDDAARAAGGLHVINAQSNLSARLDRQLAGRAARQDDPGSVQLFWKPGNHDHHRRSDETHATILGQCASSGIFGAGSAMWPQAVLRWAHAWPQWQEERRRRRSRERLRRQERDWERRLDFSRPVSPR